MKVRDLFILLSFRRNLNPSSIIFFFSQNLLLKIKKLYKMYKNIYPDPDIDLLVNDGKIYMAAPSTVISNF